jgi:transposase
MANLLMSSKEVNRLDIINRLMRHEINGSEAAARLSLSVRQIRRLKKKVKKFGAAGLINGRRGQPSNRKIPAAEEKKIVSLLHRHYADFKPSFAAEKLAEVHHITRDPKTIRRIMIEEELWQAKSRRERVQHREWRERRAAFGELVQFDGSYEYWFENRGSKCCLLAAIDDATGRIIKAQFAENEGVVPVFRFWSEYSQIQGKPQAIYLDKFSTYKMNQKVALENHDLKTQFQRAAAELGIELIFANSPQAKGRVERLFQTLQDRLIKELRLAKISDITAANEFLEKVFLPKFNQQFQVEPRQKNNFHRSLNQAEKKNLASVFSRQTDRRVQNDWTISYENQWLQLVEEQPITVCKENVVSVEESFTGELKIRFREKYLNFKRLPDYAKQRHKKAKQPWVLTTAVVNQQQHKMSQLINNASTKVGHL